MKITLTIMVIVLPFFVKSEEVTEKISHFYIHILCWLIPRSFYESMLHYKHKEIENPNWQEADQLAGLFNLRARIVSTGKETLAKEIEI